MAAEALEVSIDKQAVCFEKDTFSLSSKSYLPEQRVKLLFLSPVLFYTETTKIYDLFRITNLIAMVFVYFIKE